MHKERLCSERGIWFTQFFLYSVVTIGLTGMLAFHLMQRSVITMEDLHGYASSPLSWTVSLATTMEALGVFTFAGLSLCSFRQLKKNTNSAWVVDRSLLSLAYRIIAIAAASQTATCGWLLILSFLSPTHQLSSAALENFVNQRSHIVATAGGYRETLDVQIFAQAIGRNDVALIAANFRKHHVDGGCEAHTNESDLLNSELGELYERERDDAKAEFYYKRVADKLTPSLKKDIDMLKRGDYFCYSLESPEHAVATLATFYQRHNRRDEAAKLFEFAEESANADKMPRLPPDSVEITDSNYLKLSYIEKCIYVSNLPKAAQVNCGRITDAAQAERLSRKKAFHGSSILIGTDFPHGKTPLQMTSREASRFYFNAEE